MTFMIKLLHHICTSVVSPDDGGSDIHFKVFKIGLSIYRF